MPDNLRDELISEYLNNSFFSDPSELFGEDNDRAVSILRQGLEASIRPSLLALLMPEEVVSCLCGQATWCAEDLRAVARVRAPLAFVISPPRSNMDTPPRPPQLCIYTRSLMPWRQRRSSCLPCSPPASATFPSEVSGTPGSVLDSDDAVFVLMRLLPIQDLFTTAVLWSRPSQSFARMWNTAPRLTTCCPPSWPVLIILKWGVFSVVCGNWQNLKIKCLKLIQHYNMSHFKIFQLFFQLIGALFCDRLPCSFPPIPLPKSLSLVWRLPLPR